MSEVVTLSSSLISQIGTILSSVLQWIGSVMTTLVAQPIVLFFIGFGLTGAVIRWARRLVHFG